MAGGTRVDLGSLVGAKSPTGARVPNIGRSARAVPTDQVAPNPLNTRVIDPNSEQIRELADSIESQGQLEASTVVTRSAFLATFPEQEQTIGAVRWVQVTGGQRYAACVLKSLDLEISVKDELAESRARFVTATATENLKRNAYNAIEEAEAVARVVQENGDNQTKAAQELGMTQPWVSQRINVLKLAPDVRTYLRGQRVPVREIRGTLYKRPAEEQMAVVRSLVKAKERVITAVITEPGESPVPTQRERPAFTRAQKLGSRLVKVDRDTVLEALLLRFPGADREALSTLLQDPLE